MLPKAAQGFPNLERKGEKQKNKGKESMLREVGEGKDGERTDGSYTEIFNSVYTLLFPVLEIASGSITHGALKSQGFSVRDQ